MQRFKPYTHKTGSKDEFLVILMKWRFGVLVTDLSWHFQIYGVTFTLRYFCSWIRGDFNFKESSVHTPDIEPILAASPKRYI